MVKYNRTCSQRTIPICLAHCRYNWLKSYSPGQIYIMQSEKLFADPTVEMERLTNWLGMRPHYKHEQQQFQIVGSRHMQEFNSQFLKNNVGKKDSVFAKTVDCDKDIINVSACRGDTKWLPLTVGRLVPLFVFSRDPETEHDAILLFSARIADFLQNV